MEAGQCGVTGPLTMSLTASAFLSPVAMRIIFFERIIEPMPMVMA